MENILNLINENTIYILIAMAGMLFIVFSLCIILCIKQAKLRKRYDFFMGANQQPNVSLEEKLNEYFEQVCDIKEKYEKVLDTVNNMNENMNFCIQKVGVVRYNPFDELGGNLCFCVAMLDGKDNGVVLNGIHSKNGSYTYAKPIEMGVSPYVLSKEELEALEKAKNSAYDVQPKKIVKSKQRKQVSASMQEKENQMNNLFEKEKKTKQNSAMDKAKELTFKMDYEFKKEKKKEKYSDIEIMEKSKVNNMFAEMNQEEILKEAMQIVKNKIVS